MTEEETWMGLVAAEVPVGENKKSDDGLRIWVEFSQIGSK